MCCLGCGAFALAATEFSLDQLPAEAQRSGVAVVIEPSSIKQLNQLTENNSWLVLATVADREQAHQWREALGKQGLSGRVSIVETPSQQIPTIANYAQLIVVDKDRLGSKAPSQEEIERALAPFGSPQCTHQAIGKHASTTYLKQWMIGAPGIIMRKVTRLVHDTVHWMFRRPYVGPVAQVEMPVVMALMSDFV